MRRSIADGYAMPARATDRLTEADRPALPPIFALLWPGAGLLDGVSDEDWLAIDRIAETHRLRPALHAATRSGDIVPSEVLRERWADAHAHAARRALRVRATLLEVGKVLNDAGIEAIALKGNALAWRKWFDPALRPMRDVDVLVRAHEASAAQAALLASGFALAGPDASEKHLPPLRSARGITVEIHRHVLDPYGGEWRASDAVLRTACWNHAEPLAGAPGILAPADTELLLHLIVHAAIDSQFNNGPQVLLDAQALTTHATIDWDRFWQVASTTGALRAAELILSMVRLLSPDARIAWPTNDPPVLPVDLIEATAGLMVAERAAWDWHGTAGRALSRGWRGALAIAIRGIRRIPQRLTGHRHTSVTSSRPSNASLNAKERFRVARWLVS